MLILHILYFFFSQAIPNESISYGKYVDSRDGNVYRTIVIGEQKWIAQNINYSGIESWCGYESDSCKLNGRYYSFNSSKNACPSGYHLPLRKEFDTLAIRAGGPLLAGVMLKARTTFPDFNGLNGNGVDKFGWFGLPTGRRTPEGIMLSSITLNGGNEYYWTSEKYDSEKGYRYLLGHGVQTLTSGYDPIGNGFSVRCLNDTLFYDKKNVVDTVHDTIIIKNNIVIYDTLKTEIVKNIIDTVTDTLLKEIQIVKTDTFYIKDTLVLAKCSLTIDENKYAETLIRNTTKSNIGQITTSSTRPNEGISILISSNDNVNLQVYIYDNLGISVNSKNISDKGDFYLNWGGRDYNGNSVNDGIYIIRIFSQHYDKVTNNLYTVGVEK